MKQLLILTGPQGSGNHLWSKIFALHPQVSGWRALLDTYWVGHDQEPFADCWRDPGLLHTYNWKNADWHVTSISVPYMDNGTATVPDFKGFVREAQSLGIKVKFAILGRDRNIVEMQQQRVREGITLSQALAQYAPFATPVFLSYELLHLYGTKYLETVAKQLEFPISINDPRLAAILSEDTNTKYFSPVKHHATDDLAKHASRKHT